MALQTSGAIALSDIQTEFGGSNPISISEYNSVGGNSLSDFYGLSNITITYYLREGTVGNTASSNATSPTGDAVYSGIDLRAVKSATAVEVYINEAYTSASSTKYDTSGNSSSLSGDTEVLAFDVTGYTPDQLMIDWVLSQTVNTGNNSFGVATNETPAATYDAADGVYQTLSTSQSIGVRFRAFADATPSAAQATGTVTLTVYGKVGTEVTELGNLKFSLSASSEDIGL
jgi:hypothetical protein